MRQKHYYKDTVAGLLGGLPFSLDSKYTHHNEGEALVISLSINEGFTYDHLGRLSRIFDTVNINVTNCYHGYYGDHDDSTIAVTVPSERAGEFLLTAVETLRIDAAEETKRRRLQLLHLEEQSRALKKEMGL